MKKIQIRVDGCEKTGYGHLLRCSALASILHAHFEVSFYCKTIPDSLFSELSAEYFVMKIENEAEFFNSIEKNSTVVLDGYNFDLSDHKEIRNRGGKLLVIDDLHDQDYYADVIINYAPYITPEHYAVDPSTKLALGPEYTLLRPAFLKQAAKRRTIKSINSVLICFGGSDFLNLTPKALKVALACDSFAAITVVTGSDQNKNEIERLTRKNQNRVKYLQFADEEELRMAMLQSDVAVVSSSTVLLEAISCSCLPIICYFVKNQEEFHLYMHKEVGIRSFGNNAYEFQENTLRVHLHSIEPEENSILDSIRARMSASAKNHLKLLNSL